MSKGVTAFYIVTALTLTISMLAGLGYYSNLNVTYSDSSNDDVEAAADALVGQEASDKSGGSVLQEFTTSAGRTLATAWQVIANLGGVLILLFGAPAIVASTIQTAFQISYSVFFAAFIRGLVVD